MDELEAVKADLEARKRKLDMEIDHYPPPIPACDEQFNHLLKERERILAELKELQKKYPKP